MLRETAVGQVVNFGAGDAEGFGGEAQFPLAECRQFLLGAHAEGPAGPAAGQGEGDGDAAAQGGAVEESSAVQGFVVRVGGDDEQGGLCHVVASVVEL
ncbi:hypothetical protein KCMC57_up14640 [Kitasatospora sp. CMC57]|uniref:Uncharacterized protein n=1 Tax=Kitasatospora sp. CMC57 TaxID=3231513 RepID=A0AB33JQJ6_9ACTN